MDHDLGRDPTSQWVLLARYGYRGLLAGGVPLAIR
jgi:hypothetical protein